LADTDKLAMSRMEEQALAAASTKGVTIGQISKLLEVTPYVINNRIDKLQPIGTRRGAPVYNLREAAALLSTPVLTGEEIEHAIMKMSPGDLPKRLHKDFWLGLRSRQQYEKEAGDLWPTAKIIENVGAVYKLVAMSVRLTGDAVERQVELTERQRAIIKDQMNGMLKNVEKLIKEKFAEPESGGPAQVSDDDL
jgi:hypothetical protein